MKVRPQSQVSYVTAADGSPLAICDLPRANTQRWTTRHKANVVAAVRGGIIGLEEACRRYELTIEEFSAWSEAVDRFGISGLRSTRMQEYRKKSHNGQTRDALIAIAKHYGSSGQPHERVEQTAKNLKHHG
jgi:hypothetical protein